MGDPRIPTTTRGLTLALTLFGAVFFTVVMVAIQAVPYVAHLPNSSAGLIWLAYLVLLPTIITGILSGLTAALGAFIGGRISKTKPEALRSSASVGAGVGGVVGSALFLIYLSWMYQNGPGPWIFVLGSLVTFGLFAGFVWIRIGRRARGAQTRGTSAPGS